MRPFNFSPGAIRARADQSAGWPLRLLWLGLAAFAGATDLRGDDVPNFRNEVLPILSQAGCNSGGCHGALAGKGGFRLSLFGYNPEADYFAITRELRGRRVELSDPGRSLLLTKPTTALKHKGGKRIDVNSEEYRILAAWISAGCPPPTADDPEIEELEVTPGKSRREPGEKLQLKVSVRYSDGVTRDVTRWTKFTSTDETVAAVDRDGTVTVMGPGEGAITAWFSSRIKIARVVAPFPHKVEAETFAHAPRQGFIDELVLEQLAQLNLKPSPPANDATFVRRAYLDTIGKLPTPEEARAFIRDESPANTGGWRTIC